MRVGRGANCSSPSKHIKLQNICEESLGPGLILWYDISNGKGTRDLVRGMLVRWIFRKWDVGVWTGSSWLRVGIGGGHL